MIHILLLLVLPKDALGSDIKITSENEFALFVSNVNSGTNYGGTTVYLDSDLSLSKINETIGNTSSNYFLGIFDGQGHIISDLEMNSSTSQYAGLFGYSYGLTIRNVVLDPSCSIINSFSGSSNVYVGGIIGMCYGRNRQCNIENSVNMVDVTFNGNIDSYSLYLGGLNGCLSYLIYRFFHVKNCANYGSVTHSGSSKYSYIGGVAGYFDGSSYKYKYIYNCLNYGTITHNGTTSGGLDLGGITGYSDYAYIENCVSAGKISTQNTPSNSYIGSIVGYIVDSSASIKYCYYTSELSGYEIYGRGTPESISYTFSYNNTTFELSRTVSIGSYTWTSLVDTLNAASDYYILDGYSKWLLNKDRKSINFKINNRTSSITMGYQIILLPSLASKESLWFDGWYNDSECANVLESFEITEDKELYGRFEERTNYYTITFDTGREAVSVEQITAQFEAVVPLPSGVTRGNCNVAWWVNKYGDIMGSSLTMPARNFTLYAVWRCTRIATPEDFMDFSKSVNSGTDYYNGATVYLDSDLSLSGKTLEPIGKDYSNYFRGVFDGQGHIISNLKMNTSSRYTGLFGYSNGLTIRNVVLDSSCSITNSYSGSNGVYIGGIIGYYNASRGVCNVENSVNIADITFSGKVSSSSLYLGGIAGQLYSSSYKSYVKNCANYGSVTHSGASGDLNIGGIAGYLYYSDIQNCLNYGTITHSGTTSSYLHIGGIAGYSYYAHVENCVSAGDISSTKTSYVGSIVGWLNSYTYINYCYYTSDIDVNGLYGYAYYDPNTTGTPVFSSNIDSTLISILNNQITSENNWNKWILNANNKTITFVVNANNVFSLSSQVILLPDLALNGSYSFSGWYTDPYYTVPFRSDKVTEDTTFYGLRGSILINVTLSANGGRGIPASKTVVFGNAYGELPTPNRTGYIFVGWFTEMVGGGSINNNTIVLTSSGHTLYAHWNATQYIITFDFGNKKTTQTTQSYGDAIIYPSKVPSKSFHKFRGWCTRDVVVSSDRCNVTHVPASNLTFTASFDADSGVVAGLSVGVIAMVLVVVLFAVIAFMIILKKSEQNYEFIGIELGEDEKAVNRANERVEKRILQQMGAMNVSVDFAKTLKNPLKKAEKNKGLDEILADLGAECEDDKSDDVIESFRTAETMQTYVASAAHKKENLVAVAEYLRLLYTAVREQEEYEEFGELYFGMKDIDNFMDSMDEEAISFGGIVSGFTSKRKVIRFLMSRDGKKEKEINNMPSGVLFKVKNGRGYKIGKLDEETDEVLFEINSVFKVEYVKDITKDKFAVVGLSFTSPVAENELIKL